MPVRDHDFSRRVFLWGVPVVVEQVLVVLWHLFLLFKVQPNTPRFHDSDGGVIHDAVSAR